MTEEHPDVVTLTAYPHGRRVGVFEETAGSHTFTYDDAWLQHSGEQTFTVSLPKTRRTHAGEPVRAYLQGMLPDDTRVTDRWARQFRTSASPLSLLRHVGADTAGAVQFADDHGSNLTIAGGLHPVSDSDIAAHLRALHADPAGWAFPESEFTLAGFQPKFALRRTATGWAVPWGAEPSTDIIKPGITGLAGQAMVEHRTQRAARLVGLPAAVTTVEVFDGIPVLVVERFDRTVTADGHVERVHQEDLMQALGRDPETKYQGDGGPGVHTAADVIRTACGADAANTAVKDFFKAVAFHWVTVSTDAHAKNYSLLHAPAGSRLAPMYDAASALPYPDIRG
ncbi:HipA domain-containing protein [Curtobacterium sp. MCBD17_040]|uniref:HipA domain-containing protein n=1 Tax=Curtobacterium sp. MCBD17_040 TaxID=2175674 RepID=UPI000DA90367|nr:HipA domain-containing protein [Curtobacterium sp. MCBD17_040]WIB65769.1 HipA domain-containing protein [Curtobacterium sp. MCBD17_040]